MKYSKGDKFMTIAKQIPIMTLEEYEATPEEGQYYEKKFL